MKRLTVLCCLVSLTPIAFAATSSIDQIRLYPNEGEVIRHIALDDTHDAPVITIEGLPGQTNPNGFRARILEGTGFQLGSIRFEVLSKDEIPESAARLEAEAELRRITHQIEDVKSGLDSAGKRLKLHGKLREALLDGFEESADPGSLSEAVWKNFEAEETVRTELRTLERELEAELKALDKARRVAEVRLKELVQADMSRNGRVTIDLVGSPSGPAVVELRTPVQGVGWEPVYRINARPSDGIWELDYQAKLRNRTGEAWESVPVVLLTGRPGWRLEAPELPPVFLQKPRPVEYALRRDKAIPMAAMDMAAEEVYELSAFSVESERLTTQFELTLPVPVSLGAFKEGKVVTLVTKSMEATFWSAITPLVDETAYLHGEAEISLDWPILPGPATLLVDGAISGQDHFDLTSPGDTLELGFGENAAIGVEHKALDVMDRDAGFFGKVRKYKRHYEATVTNRMPVAHTVRVAGRFPVSRDAEIEVERLEPLDVEVDKETGVFKVERTVAPGAESVFTTRFEVTAPRDWDLTGQF